MAGVILVGARSSGGDAVRCWTPRDGSPRTCGATRINALAGACAARDDGVAERRSADGATRSETARRGGQAARPVCGRCSTAGQRTCLPASSPNGSTPTASRNCWSRNAAAAPITWSSSSRCGTTTASSWHALRAALFATDRPVLVVPPQSSADVRPPRRHRLARRRTGDQGGVASAALFDPGRERVRARRHREAASHQQCRRSWRSTASPRSCMRCRSVPAYSARRCCDKAHELGADMLVMGAYQHSPLRELLLGGVTRYMLANADLPVLLRH